MTDQSTPSHLEKVQNIILVLSGKGGVGKSSVSSMLALSLLAKGHSVGILDIDLCGPSIPRVFGLDGNQVHQATSGWVPVYTKPYPGATSTSEPEHPGSHSEENGNGNGNGKRLAVMSIGFLLDSKDSAVIWRGPKKTAMIQQFLTSVYWGEHLDYLIIDTPPGTSDEHISVVQVLKQQLENRQVGSVVVTTPQAVSLSDVRKELNFCKQVQLPILGIVENMSGFVCPHCQDCAPIFAQGGGNALATEFNVPLLGTLPIDPNLSSLVEEAGGSFLDRFSQSALCEKMGGVTDLVVKGMEELRGSS